MADNCRLLLEDFLRTSFSAVKLLVEEATAAKNQKTNRKVTLFRYIHGKKVFEPFADEHFFLRGSVEYANPQLTVEEVQGVVGTRMLETCANHFCENGLHQPGESDFKAILELLKKPPEGFIVPFLLITDDVEPDRYSMNPLKKSIMDSGQSAFPVANVKTDQLKIDDAFVRKYLGKLISQKEAELIKEYLVSSNGSYLDFVDTIKYVQLSEISKLCGIDLSLFSLRMPLSTLKTEGKDGLLHYIISQSHINYASIEQAYTCMGRSMSKRTTLLTIPHSPTGFGSKRAARGKLHFDDGKFLSANVRYTKTALYPNDIDPQDVSMAVCEDNFTVTAEKLSDYSFQETPSSPQFFLYSLGSPEDAAIWHGVGATGATQLIKSYSSARAACKQGKLFKDISQKFNIKMDVPLQFNLTAEGMWSHPTHGNIDASIGSVEDLSDLVRRGMRLEYLSAFK
jgi:hypothetical protein